MKLQTEFAVENNETERETKWNEKFVIGNIIKINISSQPNV